VGYLDVPQPSQLKTCHVIFKESANPASAGWSVGEGVPFSRAMFRVGVHKFGVDELNSSEEAEDESQFHR